MNVTLADMGMTRMMGGIAPMGFRMVLHAGPAIVAAGQISLVALNVGWRTHELVILPLSAGATAGQRIAGSDGNVPETGSLGEASSSCAAQCGSGNHRRSGGWVTVTLTPGRYELVCILQNHYDDGMHQEFTVS
ncbi:MAG: sulfocyanin-like copper-binding protein [Nakamurella sp.]